MGNEISVQQTGDMSGEEFLKGLAAFGQFVSKTNTTTSRQKYAPSDIIVHFINDVAKSINWTDEKPTPTFESIAALSGVCPTFTHYIADITPVTCPVGEDLTRTFRKGSALVLLIAEENSFNSKPCFVLMKPKYENGKIVSDVIYQNTAKISEMKVTSTTTTSSTTDSTSDLKKDSKKASEKDSTSDSTKDSMKDSTSGSTSGSTSDSEKDSSKDSTKDSTTRPAFDPNTDITRNMTDLAKLLNGFSTKSLGGNDMQDLMNVGMRLASGFTKPNKKSETNEQPVNPNSVPSAEPANEEPMS